MSNDRIVNWLMEGDPAIAFMTNRDLLGNHRPDLQEQISTSGWGKALLDARNPDGTWGESYYAPKWACSHYVLLDLVNMEFPPDKADISSLVHDLGVRHLSSDGGFGIAPNDRKSDVCVTAMFLNIASHFGTAEAMLQPYVDFLLSVQIADGGFNCQINRSGCRSSSLHSTISVLEGFQRYLDKGYGYRSDEIKRLSDEARAFILRHRFYRSSRTGKIISEAFLKLPYPTRWYYNILRGLDHFRAAGSKPDPAMDEALSALLSLRRKDGLWPRMAKIPGNALLEMEPPRSASQWNTLLALRVLKSFPASRTQNISKRENCEVDPLHTMTRRRPFPGHHSLPR